MYSENTVKEMMKGAVVETLIALGMTTGELSYNKALKVYGQDFARFVREGKLTPCRVGKGRTGNKWYSVSDIIAVRIAEQRKAEIII